MPPRKKARRTPGTTSRATKARTAKAAAPAFLTPADAAARLGCSAATVRNHIAAGNIKARQNKLGHYKITPAAVDRFAKAKAKA
jgi:excisionase family DNA binding protein